MNNPNFGPSGQVVFDRTYSRVKPNGERETWDETVSRVVKGNLALVYGDESTWSAAVGKEFNDLYRLMYDFKILPAGRHLWASGVKGRQYLMNCWTSGWGETLSEHFEFTFLRLMEGGGVGANYSSRFLAPFGAPRRTLRVHVVCDPEHPDYADMLEAGVLSAAYDSDWAGSFAVEDSREGWASALTDLIDTYMTDDEVKHEDRVFDVSYVRGKGSRLKTFGGTASGPAPFARMMHEVSRVLNEAAYNAFPQRIVLGVDPASDGESVAMCATDLSGRVILYQPKVKIERVAPVTYHLTPMQAMEIDHAIAECVVSGGNRRSARMSIVRWDDPYIFDFIECKADTGKHWTTNISVEVDEGFFRALNGDASRSYREHAEEVHEAVVNGMLTNGEPGYWNSSLSNEGEIEPVYAVNPCGEITLQAWEACNLGHVNLDAFAPQHSGQSWREGELIEAHRLMTRFLLRATYADINDPKSRAVQDSNRRIGVGHFGVQGFLVKNGWKYSDVAIAETSPGFHEFRALLDRMYATVRNTARDYAFQLRIPEPVKVTTVAPTGSIAKLPGATEGIHPIYARFFEQRIRFSLTDADQAAKVEEFRSQGYVVEQDVYDQSGNTAVVVFPTKNLLVEQVEQRGYSANVVEQADELTIDQMLSFQALYQKHYADNAVSFTVNISPGLEDWALAQSLEAWLPALKGTTIMVDGTREQAPFTRITEFDYETSQTQTLDDAIDLDCATGACPIR